MNTDDLLMCPGPNDIADRVLRAMMRPAACPVTPEFHEVYEETLDVLAEVYQSRNQVVPIPGSGRSGLESAIASVVEPGDRVLVIAGGHFGNLAARVVRGVGGHADEVPIPWGGPLDLDVIQDRLDGHAFKLVTMVHNETSTGAIYENAGAVAELAHTNGALFLLDAISSLGGADVPTDRWAVDLCVSCGHKAIAAPIGHAYIAVSERAWAAMARRREPCRTIFGNLLHWRAQALETPVDGRTLKRPQGVFTAVHLIYALHEALAMVLEEGLAPRFARHAVNARAFRAGLEALELSPFATADLASPTVTCIPLPEGIQSDDFLRSLRRDHGIFTLPGLGSTADTMIRIGHMGVTAAPRCVLHCLYAIESVLGRWRAVTPGAAVERATRVYAEAQPPEPMGTQRAIAGASDGTTMAVRGSGGGARGNASSADAFDVDALVERATRATPELGAPFEFLEALRVLCDSLEHEAALTVSGRQSVAAALVGSLVTQARLSKHRQDHPEIDGIPVTRPVFIIGLPRTGSTLLHNLLAQHPELRGPNLWELMTPAGPRDARHQAEAAAACQAYVDDFYRSAPRFPAIHPFNAWRPDECHRLLGNAFQSRVYWIRFRVPSYATWLERQDLGPAYEYHRLQLKSILWRIGGGVPVLKCPFHVWSLDALARTYPDARFISLHRDPAVIVPSTASLCAVNRAVRSDAVDRVEIGRFWLAHIERVVSTVAESRRTHLAGRPVLDVRHDELTRDPLGAVGRICEFIEVPLGTDVVGAMRAFLAENPRQQHGVHRYSAEEFGLDPRDLHERFAPYRREYGVEPGPVGDPTRHRRAEG